ncbi:hypothetical protein B0A50_00307 [Salinomyces thailandicus]|uniref:JmjC domain-containing protein n=1 Tax=Salinomyces thailandicus TaxID=706561 RepID=A0A4U0UG54_9PEZI|nr:hypothetical protein B0A50_00307 [Salinomyces thailandica]
MSDEGETRGTKRKHLPDETRARFILGDNLEHLSCIIYKGLEEGVPGKTIMQCGAPLDLLYTRPRDALELALDKLNAYPFADVPAHWRELYEEASLYQAAMILKYRAAVERGRRNIIERLRPRVRIEGGDWTQEIVAVLDRGMQLSGATGRKKLYENVFQQLESLFPEKTLNGIPAAFHTVTPCDLATEQPVTLSREVLGLIGFQHWLDNERRPLIIAGALAEWPATQLWKDPRYLLGLTLGGRRLVPVEVGRLYTDDDWGQRLIPFHSFMTDYLLPEHPTEIGYLAQHDLFDHIPALKADVITPDYCWTTPPISEDEATLKTAGLGTVQQLDEPLVNAWLGPSGTRTPLHTDPYHNILCQVIGFKYVRLYPPAETACLYPQGIDDKGVNMENTSQVDISHHAARALGRDWDPDAVRVIEEQFPKFAEARYEEAILKPGECLYVPLGWWHYVESLSTSFSVSFWWN